MLSLRGGKIPKFCFGVIYNMGEREGGTKFALSMYIILAIIP
jgi:hypothetical protein